MRKRIELTWNNINTATINADDTQTTDLIEVDIKLKRITAIIKVDNQGTPVSGDRVQVFMKPKINDFEASDTDLLVGVLDTMDDDPYQGFLLELPVGFDSFKFFLKNESSTNNMIVSGVVYFETYT